MVSVGVLDHVVTPYLVREGHPTRASLDNVVAVARVGDVPSVVVAAPGTLVGEGRQRGVAPPAEISVGRAWMAPALVGEGRPWRAALVPAVAVLPA